MVQFSHEQLLTLAGFSIGDNPHSAFYSLVETDSRKVNESAVFFALPGVSSNGWDYLDNVVSLGCRVAVVPNGMGLHHDKIELIAVDDPAKLLVACLQQFFGTMPKQMAAVTGTMVNLPFVSIWRSWRNILV